MSFDTRRARELFPALQRTVDGNVAVYLDGPGGTQVPVSVIDAMAGFMRRGGSNHGGPFITSRESEATAYEARVAVADLFNAPTPSGIAFGQNMTSITLATSRALARRWGAGDEVVVSRLDHDANVWPWVIAAREAGATVRYADFDPADGCRLLPEAVSSVLSNRTRLVAVTHASNALGSVVDVAAIVAEAHRAGALVYVDAVHYAPHGPIDVSATGCDFLAASAYKFFGPHTGVLYGRSEILDDVDAVKIRPAPDRPPGKWETGTQSFESLAGVTAAVDYLASFSDDFDRRRALRSTMEATSAYEAELSRRFLDGLSSLPSVQLHGIDDAEGRTPTFAVSIDGVSPMEASERLGEVGIFTWAGHYYAVEVMARLGLLDAGGLLRIGFVHYTTPDEVDLMLEALERLAAHKGLDGLRTT